MDPLQAAGQCRTIIEDYLKARNLDLVELVSRFEGRDLVLRILVDKPQGGITIGECSSLNRDISRLLDERDIMTQGYTLEISSPGLDRPLKTRNDFMRCMNKPVHVFLNEMVENKLEWEGVITSVGEALVTLQVNGTAVEVPLSAINQGRRILT